MKATRSMLLLIRLPVETQMQCRPTSVKSFSLLPQFVLIFAVIPPYVPKHTALSHFRNQRFVERTPANHTDI